MAGRDGHLPDVYALTGGPVWTGETVMPGGTVLVRDGCIAACGPEAATGLDVPIIDVGGRLIVPGFVCGHHHFYSALATGCATRPATCFTEVLEHMWWLLDASMTLNDVRLSARWSLTQCARNGVTTVLDHHASYGAIAGSLEALADEVDAAGLSAVLCFETSNRNGCAAAEQSIAENLDFTPRERVKKLFGLHASFTLDDALLARIAEVAPPELGFHVHCAEDLVDVERSGGSVIERFARFGILRPATLLIHGVHLTADDRRQVAESGATIVHCVESNLHNGVGIMDIVAALSDGVTLAAGTDGMHSSMPRSYAAAYLAVRNRHGSPAVGFAETQRMYDTTQAMAGRYFNDLTGRLEPGTRADIVVTGYRPHTPVTDENVWAHMLYGVPAAPVYATIAGGQAVYVDGRVPWLDENALAVECNAAATALWARMGGR